MAYLGRSVDRARWSSTSAYDGTEIPADCLKDKKFLRELRTTNNALSFWTCDDASEQKLEEAALAIVGGHKDRIDAFDLVWVDSSELTAAGAQLDPSPGETFVSDLRDRHVDVGLLDMGRLSRVAGHLKTAILRDDRVRQFTRSEVIALVRRALSQRRVRLANLPSCWQKELGKE